MGKTQRTLGGQSFNARCGNIKCGLRLGSGGRQRMRRSRGTIVVMRAAGKGDG